MASGAAGQCSSTLLDQQGVACVSVWIQAPLLFVFSEIKALMITAFRAAPDLTGPNQ